MPTGQQGISGDRGILHVLNKCTDLRGQLDELTHAYRMGDAPR